MKKTLLIAITLFTLMGCDKDEPIKEPTLEVSRVEMITATTATIYFKVEEGNCPDVRNVLGVSVDISPAPTIAKSWHSAEACLLGGGKKIENLQPKTTYYVRPYIKKTDTVIYGNELSFTTL